jgi:hypothetical protein
MERTKSVHRMFAPVGVEVEPPLPDGGRLWKLVVPELEAATQVDIDIEDVIRERTGDGRFAEIRVVHLPVSIELVEADPALGAFGIGPPFNALTGLDIRELERTEIELEKPLSRVVESLPEHIAV